MRPSWSEFRFMLLCNGVENARDRADISGVLNVLAVPEFPVTVRLIVAVAAIWTPENWGRRLDLMTWRLGKNGQRESMPGQVGESIYCPRITGASVHSQPINRTFFDRGFYGFELFDREGTFAEMQSLLATCVLPVDQVSVGDIRRE